MPAGTVTAAGVAPFAGPIVLVTYSNLRSDAVGFLGGPRPTPHFDALARRAEFAGSAVAASSSPPVSAASLILGVDPWQHQLLSHLSAELRADLPTLGAVLGAQGYHSTIHYDVAQKLHIWGFFRGFDAAADLDPELRRVTGQLRDLDGGREFLWIHLRSTELPWGGPSPLDLPDLYPYADPELPLPEGLRDRARAGYVGAVRRADDDLGRILEALEQSGRRDETLLAVTALHGLEMGEHGQMLYGSNLGRESIQVPLLVDLPAAWSTRPLTGAGDRGEPDRGKLPPVALARLWPTLVGLVGGAALPLHPPSLFEPAAGPALSSLYLGNGVNLHSAVFPLSGLPAEQILVESRFAPAEAQHYPALLAMASVAAPGLAESPRRVFERLRREFVRAPPWSTSDPRTGASSVTWRLERWPRVRGTDVVDDDDAVRRRAAEAHAAWQRWVGPEETPDQARGPDTPGAILSGPLGP